MTEPLTVVAATEGDAAAIAGIYEHYVRESTASFEVEAPDASQMAARIATGLAEGYPWLLVRDAAGTVLGFAHAARFGPRAGYAHSCETSIYVHPERLGKGVGTMLLNALIEACEARGDRQAFAVIAGTEPASVVLHARAGYLPVGTLGSAGWKHDQWIDVFIMQRQLGPGNATPPGN